ncbi:MAG: hypothetical protein AAF741_00570 [Bacteroidota bacterium]
MNISYIIVILLFVSTSCNQNKEIQTTQQPEPNGELTIGLETTVVEGEDLKFLIESEKPYRKLQDSYIIAKLSDGSIKKYALPQAQLIARNSSQVKTRETEAVRQAFRGLFYHMVAGRVLSNHQPKPSAYLDAESYQKAIDDNPQLKVD